ncbi:B12-binding domain-containing radical SAM protein [Acetivibrio straminisolvens]|jgi:radical SAM superfamily enzyme YgiQ (UPF0313 family)|uniref:B12-binding domain-containing radical SAM protein n=1 Tax=Acetivibrio straminisolvens TaxID=253314 RepID=UPI00223F6148|nr:radical SAM protein [Acetivibrio straminisolvens]
MDVLLLIDKNHFGTAYDSFTSLLQMGFKRFLKNQPFQLEEYSTSLPEIEVGYSLTGVVLSTALFNAGLKFKTFDNFDIINKNKEELIQYLQTDLKCIAISTTYIDGCARLQEIVDFVRNYNKQAKIVVGGPLLLSEFEDIYTSVRQVDYFVFGDGEYSFPKLVHNICNGSETAIDGVVKRQDGSGIPEVPKNIPNIDINSAPIPKWELIHEYFIGDDSTPTPTIEAVRGCAFRCLFCTYPIAGRFRTKNPERIVEEMKHLKELGYDAIRFIGSNFTFPQDWCIQVCNEISASKIGMEFFCFGRVTDLTDEVVAALKTAGCSQVFLGVESAHEPILNAMGKKTLEKDILPAFERLNKNDIYSTGSFIIGFPGETQDTVKKVADLIKDSKMEYYHLFSLGISKGCRLFKERDKFNLRINDELIRTSKFYTSWEHDTMSSKEVPGLQMQVFKDVYHHSESVIGLIPRLIREYKLNSFFKDLDKFERKKLYQLFQTGMFQCLRQVDETSSREIWNKIIDLSRNGRKKQGV